MEIYLLLSSNKKACKEEKYLKILKNYNYIFGVQKQNNFFRPKHQSGSKK